MSAIWEVHYPVQIFRLKTLGLLIPFLMLAWRVSGSADATPILFDDVSAGSGLAIERIVAAEKRYLVETMGGGVAWIDYDGDGWLDAYLTNCPTVESARAGRMPSNRLYRNNRDGSFRDMTTAAGVGYRGWSMGVSVADYDLDGDQDLYLTNVGPNLLYRNNGDGTFTEVAKVAGVDDSRWSASSGWGDYDGDGDPDLFVANYVEYDLTNLPEFGRGRYCLFRSLEVLCGPRGMKGAGDTLYRNNGDGTFSDVSRTAGVADDGGRFGLGCVWSDLDRDGDQDLYVTNDTQANYLYLNDGRGRFNDAGLLSGAALDLNGKARAGMGIAVGDYDRDGRFDIAVTNFSDESYAIFHNDGEGEFTDRAGPLGVARLTLPYLGWGILFADFDNDGWLDLFATNGHVYPQVDRVRIGTSYRQGSLLLRGTGSGQLVDVTAPAGGGLTTPRSHRGAALGDYDNDGDLDLLLMDLDGQPLLLRNRRSGPGNYLRIRAPIGVRIEIEAGGEWRSDEVRASGSYQSASEPVAHFGLGEIGTVAQVRIKLPNGRTRSMSSVPANQTLTIGAK